MILLPRKPAIVRAGGDALDRFGQLRLRGGVFPFPQYAIPGVPALATFIANTKSTSDLSTYTFSSQTLTASMVIGTGRSGAATQTITSVTAGGITATEGIKIADSDGTTVGGLYYVTGVTPGTGNIVIAGAAAGRCAIGTWEITGQGASPHHTASGAGLIGAADATLSLNIAANGFAVGFTHTGGDTTTIAWTGLTEKYEEMIEGDTTHHSGASDNFTDAETGRTVKAARSNTGTRFVVVALSFAPA